MTYLVFVNTACVGVVPPVRVLPAAAGQTGVTKAAMPRENITKQFVTATENSKQ